MKKLAINSLFTIFALFDVSAAVASHTAEPARDNDAGHRWAKVVDVQPVVRVVRVSSPEESCWNEPVRQTAQNYRSGYGSATPVILGGILGGVAGNQFGGGRGNDVMTIAGALLGASIGRDAAHRRHYRASPARYVTERRCEVREVYRDEERIEGYQVTYKYQGQTYVTRMDSDPGRRIRVRVQVEPVGRY